MTLPWKLSERAQLCFCCFCPPRTDQKLPERGCLLLSFCSVPGTAYPTMCCGCLSCHGRRPVMPPLLEVGMQQPPAFGICTAARFVGVRKLTSTYTATLSWMFTSSTLPEQSPVSPPLKNLFTFLLFSVFLSCCSLTPTDPGPSPKRRKMFQLILKSLSKPLIQKKKNHLKSLTE